MADPTHPLAPVVAVLAKAYPDKDIAPDSRPQRLKINGVSVFPGMGSTETPEQKAAYAFQAYETVMRGRKHVKEESQILQATRAITKVFPGVLFEVRSIDARGVVFVLKLDGEDAELLIPHEENGQLAQKNVAVEFQMTRERKKKQKGDE